MRKESATSSTVSVVFMIASCMTSKGNGKIDPAAMGGNQEKPSRNVANVRDLYR